MLKDVGGGVTKDFGAGGRDAINIIEKFEKNMKLSPRVSRSVVVLAQGDIEKLREAVGDAENDWHNVIESAERRPFELNSPFK